MTPGEGGRQGRDGFAGLDACVHCGFCLQACPTFLATGDEADSPRGRIALMRALEQGDLEVDDPDLTLHLDRCLGCRGCEPVCPSGVGYGRGLEAARAVITARRGVPVLARLALWALTTTGVSRIVYALARALRNTGVPAMLAGWGRVGFAMGMLAATRQGRTGADRDGQRRTKALRASDTVRPRPPLSALLFRGCIMEGLFRHVHDATIRTLTVNGYTVRETAAGGCCGALHAHAGLADEAREDGYAASGGDHGARRFQAASVPHARRTHWLAAPAAEAAIEVQSEIGVVDRELALLQGAHQRDAAAGAVGFVAGGEERRAGLQAEPAVHAGVQRGETAAVTHRPRRR